MYICMMVSLSTLKCILCVEIVVKYVCVINIGYVIYAVDTAYVYQCTGLKTIAHLYFYTDIVV